MPGLMRGMARTAVIAGTATAVSGRVARRQAGKFAEQDAQTMANRNQAYYQDMAQQAPAPASAPAPSGGGDDVLDQLTKLGELHAAGVLTDEEFAAQKAKILG